jgi:hypothetical protein
MQQNMVVREETKSDTCDNICATRAWNRQGKAWQGWCQSGADLACRFTAGVDTVVVTLRLLTKSLREGQFHLATNHGNCSKGGMIHGEDILMNSTNFVSDDVKSNVGNAGHYINKRKEGCPWCYCHEMAHDSQIQMAMISAKLATSMEEERVQGTNTTGKATPSRQGCSA